MIINIRGTSGSGKTTVMRHFISQCTQGDNIYAPAIGKRKPRVEAIECLYKGEPVYVLGSYDSACGGCDTINNQNLVCEYIEKYKTQGHVLFEGLMISHIYERYAAQARLDKDNWLFIMLETPFEKCLQHITDRRVAAGNTKPLGPKVPINARRTYDSTYRIRTKFTAEDISWEELPMYRRLDNFDSILGVYL